MWRGRYDRRALIGIALVYLVLILSGLTAGVVYRSDLGQLVGDIHDIIYPTPVPSSPVSHPPS